MAAHPDQASMRPHNARLETLGTMASGIAHEINTPIQFISDSFATIDDLLQHFAALHNAAVAGKALDAEAKTVAEALKDAERDLLEKTLSGSIKVLTDVLGLIDPDSFGRTERTQRWCRAIAEELGLKAHAWKLETAIMLAPIGLAALPPDVAEKARSGKALTSVEKEMVDTTVETAHKLICNIPRLHEVASFVQFQGRDFDGSGFPNGDRAGANIPIGARIIRILNDFVQAEEKGAGVRDTLAAMQKRNDLYDLTLLELIAPVILKDEADEADGNIEEFETDIGQLRVGDVLQTAIMDIEQDDLILVHRPKQTDQVYLEKLMQNQRDSAPTTEFSECAGALAAGATISELYIKRLGNLRRLRKPTDTVKVRRPKDHTVLAKTA